MAVVGLSVFFGLISFIVFWGLMLEEAGLLIEDFRRRRVFGSSSSLNKIHLYQIDILEY